MSNLDDCLRLLSDQHRRQIIHLLRHEANGFTTVDELVDRLYNPGADFKNGPPGDRKELVVQLQHTHLPKLAAYGVIEFDSRTGAVRYDPDEQVETVLDALPTEAAPTSGVPHPKNPTPDRPEW